MGLLSCTHLDTKPIENLRLGDSVVVLTFESPSFGASGLKYKGPHMQSLCPLTAQTYRSWFCISSIFHQTSVAKREDFLSPPFFKNQKDYGNFGTNGRDFFLLLQNTI